MSEQEIAATIIAGEGTQLSPSLLKDAVGDLEKAGAEVLAGDWLSENEAADIICTGLGMPQVQSVLGNWFGLQPFDVIIQPAETRRKTLLLADMESTIIEQEMLDELAELIGVGDKVASITRRAMNGELDFAAALKERVRLLKGQPVSLLDRAATRISLMAGAETLVATMKANGAACWLASGGFTFFARIVAERLGFEGFFANKLITGDGAILGIVAEPILDKDGKQALLTKLCAEQGLKLKDSVTVGDGANDVPMLMACNKGGGLGVAFQAKPKVRAAVPYQINHGDLTALLFAQGYGREEFISSL